jgi:hypothetical protein
VHVQALIKHHKLHLQSQSGSVFSWFLSQEILISMLLNTLVCIHRNFGSIRPDANFYTWLFTNDVSQTIKQHLDFPTRFVHPVVGILAYAHACLPICKGQASGRTIARLHVRPCIPETATLLHSLQPCPQSLPNCQDCKDVSRASRTHRRSAPLRPRTAHPAPTGQLASSDRHQPHRTRSVRISGWPPQPPPPPPQPPPPPNSKTNFSFPQHPPRHVPRTPRRPPPLQLPQCEAAAAAATTGPSPLASPTRTWTLLRPASGDGKWPAGLGRTTPSRGTGRRSADSGRLGPARSAVLKVKLLRRGGPAPAYEGRQWPSDLDGCSVSRSAKHPDMNRFVKITARRAYASCLRMWAHQDL